ncbi:MAG: hypothetical protein O8C61_10520 [Candidatus Methanoperedens sp.]|nr:hypothetical protein [Candidatus Methanoperedens sp.]
MDSKFDREQNLKERLRFISFYAKWVKTVPNEIWSKQQAEFIDSLFDNAKNFSLTPEKYLKTIRR